MHTLALSAIIWGACALAFVAGWYAHAALLDARRHAAFDAALDEALAVANADHPAAGRHVRVVDDAS